MINKKGMESGLLFKNLYFLLDNLDEYVDESSNYISKDLWMNVQIMSLKESAHYDDNVKYTKVEKVINEFDQLKSKLLSAISEMKARLNNTLYIVYKNLTNDLSDILDYYNLFIKKIEEMFAIDETTVNLEKDKYDLWKKESDNLLNIIIFNIEMSKDNLPYDIHIGEDNKLSANPESEDFICKKWNYIDGEIGTIRNTTAVVLNDILELVTISKDDTNAIISNVRLLENYCKLDYGLLLKLFKNDYGIFMQFVFQSLEKWDKLDPNAIRNENIFNENRTYFFENKQQKQYYRYFYNNSAPDIIIYKVLKELFKDKAIPNRDSFITETLKRSTIYKSSIKQEIDFWLDLNNYIGYRSNHELSLIGPEVLKSLQNKHTNEDILFIIQRNLVKSFDGDFKSGYKEMEDLLCDIRFWLCGNENDDFYLLKERIDDFLKLLLDNGVLNIRPSLECLYNYVEIEKNNTPHFDENKYVDKIKNDSKIDKKLDLDLLKEKNKEWYDQILKAEYFYDITEKVPFLQGDYSACLMGYCECIEDMLFQIIASPLYEHNYEDFIRYVVEKKINKNQAYENLLYNQISRYFGKFTIGDLQTFLYKDDNDYRKNKIIKLLGLKTTVGDLKVANYQLYEFNSEYRNKIAHRGVINKSTASECRKLVLEAKSLIAFLERL